MPTTRELLTEAGDRLRAAGVPSPEVDAELLLAHVTGRPRALLRLAGSPIPPRQGQRFVELVGERARRVPLQHLTGRAPFRHLDLHVGPGVFIPRPETELIVDEVIRFVGPHRAGERLSVVDLCAGSAALALSIGTEIPDADVVAVELSPPALAWAGRNLDEAAARLEALGSTVELVAGDARWVGQPDGQLAGLRGTVDVVITNPPYVPRAAVPLEPEVRDHDPDLALYGGEDGLDVVRSLAVQAALLLRPGGLFVVEHADVQGEAAGPRGVPALLRAQRHTSPGAGDGSVWGAVHDLLDLAGRPRHTSATLATDRMSG